MVKSSAFKVKRQSFFLFIFSLRSFCYFAGVRVKAVQEVLLNWLSECSTKAVIIPGQR